MTMSDYSDDEDDTRRSDVDNNESNDNRKTSLLLDEVPPAKNVGRKRTIDESALNPDESRKLETRRAYNRQCAAKGMLLLISHGGQWRASCVRHFYVLRSLDHSSVASNRERLLFMSVSH